MDKNKKNSTGRNFVVQGSILAVASILVRLIGVVYRVPMTNIIHDSGNGYYSNAYTIYSMMLLLSSYSLPLAVSKLVSVHSAIGKWKNVEKILKSALIFSAISGGIFSLLVGFGAEFFTATFMKNELASIALRFLAPTILIMGFLGTFRGFFQGLHTMIPTAFSQIIEQIINAIVSVGAAALLFSYGSKVDELKQTTEYKYAWGAAGGTIGTGVGALIALIFFLILFQAYHGVLKKKVKRDRTESTETCWTFFKIIVATAIPVILSTAVYNIIDLVDASLFSYYMQDTKQYNEIWGAYSAKYLLLIHVPVAFASAMASAAVPSISEAYAKKDRKTIIVKTKTTLQVVLYIAIPSMVGLMILANPVIHLLFRNDTSSAALYLMVGSVAVLFFSLATVTNGILQGINKMTVPVKNAVIALGVHILLFYLVTWKMNIGIYGVIVSYVGFGICMATLNCFAITKYLGYQQNILKLYILPLLSAVVMGIFCFFTYNSLAKLLGGTERFISLFICVMASILVSVVVYFICTVLFRSVNEAELRTLPMGHKLVVIAKKLRLLPK